MNDWKSLEERLRSWTPRAPSEKVKARLFGPHRAAAAGAAAEAPAQPAAWHWLAPAMAMFVFGLFVVGRSPTAFGPGSGLLGQLGPEEPLRIAYCAANAVQVMTFNWTNAGHSPTTAPPVSRTNTLFQ